MKSGQTNPSLLSSSLILPLVVGIIFLNVGATIYGAHWLRPAADDYCFAWIVGAHGIVGSVVDSWTTLNGYITSIFLASMWVGWPLAHLPFSLASAVPFLAAALSMGIAVYCLVSHFMKFGHWHRVVIPVGIAFLWWVFLWASDAFNGIVIQLSSFSVRETLLLTKGLTHWQALNGVYVVQLGMMLVSLSIALHYCPPKSAYRLVCLMILGLLIGMMGPTLAFSIIVFLGAHLLYAYLQPKRDFIFSKFELLGLNFSILGSFLVSQFLSPGNQKRQALIDNHFDLSIMNLLDLVDTAFRFSIKFWVSSYFSLGSIIIFLLVAGLTYLYSPFFLRNKKQEIFSIGFIFATFALLQIFVNRSAEFFAYQGYWHFISAIACIFISLIFFGISAGKFLIEVDQQKKSRLVIGFIVVITCLMGTSSNVAMIKSMYERQSRWSGGPAPSEGIADIEEQWIRGCWQHLNTLRTVQLER